MNGERWFVAWFLLCAAVASGLVGVGIWALVSVVDWLVTK